MAWKPVAEAAAGLGVSERTIWRRIKSKTIESRTENGRTLVSLSETDAAGDSVRQLSHVAAAQLSMRKLDADTFSDVLAVMADYRSTFDDHIARSRRAARWAASAALVLLVALGGGIWYHGTTVSNLQQAQLQTVGGMRLEHQRAVAEAMQQRAEAEGSSAARADEISHLRGMAGDQQARLLAVETSRDSLQQTVDQRLAAVEKATGKQQDAIEARDRESARLQEIIGELRNELHAKEVAHLTVRKQADRINESFRRAAAHNRGLAEGLRIHVMQQQKAIERLRRELAAGQADPDAVVSPPRNVDREELRRRILESFLSQEQTDRMTGLSPGEGQPADADDASERTSLLRLWLHAWIDAANGSQGDSAVARAQP